MRKQWNGLLVCRDDWSPQHPQEFARAVSEKIKYPGDVRPEPAENFTGLTAVTFGGDSVTVEGEIAIWSLT
jgi:hypothetical protein